MARTTHETRFLLTAQNKTKTVFKSVQGSLGSLGRAVTGLHAQLLGLAGIGGFGFLAKQLIDVNAEFQTIKSSLKTVTGGAEEAAKAFNLIEDFATTTPFALQEVTQSFIKLKALGLDPSERALRSYGNTSAALGKSLDQMIEAVADAATGEFERLKEFGIKASKEKENVTFTFQGISTTIKNNSEDIQRYLLGIGENQFGGAMADQMNNITPAFSNLEAAIKGFAVELGEAGLNDIIADLVNDTTAWVNALDSSKVVEFAKDTVEVFQEVAGAIDTVTDAIGRAHALTDRGFTRLPGTGQLPGGSAGYRLGDFNNAQTTPNPQTFQEWAEAIRENTDALKNESGARAQ